MGTIIVGNAVSIEGLDTLRRALKLIAPEVAKQFRRDLKGVAQVVATEAQANIPRASGAAASSMRASTSGPNAQVRAGGPAAPYYGWLDFGGTLHPTGGRHNTIKRGRVKGGRYLYPAFNRHRDDLVKGALNAIQRATRSSGLV